MHLLSVETLKQCSPPLLLIVRFRYRSMLYKAKYRLCSSACLLQFTIIVVSLTSSNFMLITNMLIVTHFFVLHCLVNMPL